MFVVFPTGFWLFSFVLDLVYVAGGGSDFATMSWYSMGAGIIGALAAVLSHAVSLPARALGCARKATIWYRVSSLLLLGLFVTDFLLRVRAPHGSVTGFVLTCVGMPLLVISRWLYAVVSD